MNQPNINNRPEDVSVVKEQEVKDNEVQIDNPVNQETDNLSLHLESLKKENYKNLSPEEKLKKDNRDPHKTSFEDRFGVGENVSFTDAELSELEKNGIDITDAYQNKEGVNDKLNEAQGAMEAVFRASTKGILKGGLGVVESVGYLADIPELLGNHSDTDNAFTNGLSKWAVENKESLEAYMPTYSGKTGDFGWMMQVFEGVVDSAVQFGAVGGGVGTVLSKGAKALKIANTVLGEARVVQLGTAAATNYVESMMNASQLYKEIKQSAIDNGMTDAYATKLAEEKATQSIYASKVLILTDAIALNGALSPSSLTKGAAQKTLKEKGKDFVQNSIAEVGEEVYQEVLGNELKREAQKEYTKVDKTSFLGRTGDFITSDEGITTVVSAILGGPFQSAAAKAMTFVKPEAKFRDFGLEEVKKPTKEVQDPGKPPIDPETLKGKNGITADYFDKADKKYKEWEKKNESYQKYQGELNAFNEYEEAKDDYEKASILFEKQKRIGSIVEAKKDIEHLFSNIEKSNQEYTEALATGDVSKIEDVENQRFEGVFKMYADKESSEALETQLQQIVQKSDNEEEVKNAKKFLTKLEGYQQAYGKAMNTHKDDPELAGTIFKTEVRLDATKQALSTINKEISKAESDLDSSILEQGGEMSSNQKRFIAINAQRQKIEEIKESLSKETEIPQYRAIKEREKEVNKVHAEAKKELVKELRTKENKDITDDELVDSLIKGDKKGVLSKANQEIKDLNKSMESFDKENTLEQKKETRELSKKKTSINRIKRELSVLKKELKEVSKNNVTASEKRKINKVQSEKEQKENELNELNEDYSNIENNISVLKSNQLANKEEVTGKVSEIKSKDNERKELTKTQRKKIVDINKELDQIKKDKIKYEKSVDKDNFYISTYKDLEVRESNLENELREINRDIEDTSLPLHQDVSKTKEYKELSKKIALREDLMSSLFTYQNLSDVISKDEFALKRKDARFKDLKLRLHQLDDMNSLVNLSKEASFYGFNKNQLKELNALMKKKANWLEQRRKDKIEQLKEDAERLATLERMIKEEEDNPTKEDKITHLKYQIESLSSQLEAEKERLIPLIDNYGEKQRLKIHANNLKIKEQESLLKLTLLISTKGGNKRNIKNKKKDKKRKIARITDEINRLKNENDFMSQDNELLADKFSEKESREQELIKAFYEERDALKKDLLRSQVNATKANRLAATKAFNLKTKELLEKLDLSEKLSKEDSSLLSKRELLISQIKKEESYLNNLNTQREELENEINKKQSEEIANLISGIDSRKEQLEFLLKSERTDDTFKQQIESLKVEVKELERKKKEILDKGQDLEISTENAFIIADIETGINETNKRIRIAKNEIKDLSFSSKELAIENSIMMFENSRRENYTNLKKERAAIERALQRLESKQSERLRDIQESKTEAELLRNKIINDETYKELDKNRKIIEENEFAKESIITIDLWDNYNDISSVELDVIEAIKEKKKTLKKGELLTPKEHVYLNYYLADVKEKKEREENKAEWEKTYGDSKGQETKTETKETEVVEPTTEDVLRGKIEGGTETDNITKPKEAPIKIDDKDVFQGDPNKAFANIGKKNKEVVKKEESTIPNPNELDEVIVLNEKTKEYEDVGDYHLNLGYNSTKDDDTIGNYFENTNPGEEGLTVEYSLEQDANNLDGVAIGISFYKDGKPLMSNNQHVKGWVLSPGNKNVVNKEKSRAYRNPIIESLRAGKKVTAKVKKVNGGVLITSKENIDPRPFLKEKTLKLLTSKDTGLYDGKTQDPDFMGITPSKAGFVYIKTLDNISEPRLIKLNSRHPSEEENQLVLSILGRLAVGEDSSTIINDNTLKVSGISLGGALNLLLFEGEASNKSNNPLHVDFKAKEIKFGNSSISFKDVKNDNSSDEKVQELKDFVSQMWLTSNAKDFGQRMGSYTDKDFTWFGKEVSKDKAYNDFLFEQGNLSANVVAVEGKSLFRNPNIEIDVNTNGLTEATIPKQQQKNTNVQKEVKQSIKKSEPKQNPNQSKGNDGKGTSTTTPKVKPTGLTKKQVDDKIQIILGTINSEQKRIKKVDEKGGEKSHYLLDGKTKLERVSNIIGTEFKRDSSLYEDSRQAGNTVDGVVRQFFIDSSKLDFDSSIDMNGKTHKISDRMDKKSFNDLKKSLAEIKTKLDKEGDVFVTNNLFVFDKELNASGEIDILSYNENTGKFSIYDIKTSKEDYSTQTKKYTNDLKTPYINQDGDEVSKINLSKQDKHKLQLSAYANLFERMTGEKIDKIGIIPIQVNYDSEGSIKSKGLKSGVTRNNGVQWKSSDALMDNWIPVVGKPSYLNKKKETTQTSNKEVTLTKEQKELIESYINKLVEEQC